MVLCILANFSSPTPEKRFLIFEILISMRRFNNFKKKEIIKVAKKENNVIFVNKREKEAEVAQM